jgi:hypothetical protein
MAATGEREAEANQWKRRRAALFSLYLRCEDVAHRAHASDCAGCAQCGRRTRGISLLPRQLAPHSLSDALDVLLDDRSPGSAHALRMATAAICRGVDALAPDERDQALRRLETRLDGGRQAGLGRLCTDVRDRKQRHTAALNLMHGCQLRHFDVLWQRSPHMVTTVEVSVETSRPIDQFKTGLMDPRRWDETIPLVWPKAYLIKGPLPVDRSRDPTPNEAASVDFSGLFYEEAAWPANFAELGLWRNVLRMNYQVSADKVRFDFTEYQCLTSRYFGIDSEGGIDCDNGFGEARALPDGWTRLTAKKTFRFTKPDLLAVPLNAISSIWLLFLLEGFVLFGACPP